MDSFIILLLVGTVYEDILMSPTLRANVPLLVVKEHIVAMSVSMMEKRI